MTQSVNGESIPERTAQSVKEEKMKKDKRGAWGWKTCILLGVLAIMAFAAKNEFLYRVVWDQGTIMRNPTFFKEIISNASTNGYNGIIFVDYHLQEIDKQSPAFFSKYKDVLSHAKLKKIHLIPWTLWQGFPAYENYNLSESFPVRGTKFVVQGKEARGIGDHNVGLKNGGFESFTGNKPTGWTIAGKAKAFYADKTTKKNGSASFCVQSAKSGFLIQQSIKVKPFRAYQISAWFKSQGLKKATGVVFYVEPHLLARYDRPFGTPKRPAFSGTMNWKKCVTDFNSLHETNVKLTLFLAYHVSAADSQAGTIWIDDLKVREVGLYETVRSKSRPITVKSVNGSKTYYEGKDYIVDPKCNNMTLETYDYEGHLKIPAGSAIQDKQELRVDWHQYANVRTIVAASDFCLPETWTTMRSNVKQIDDLMGVRNAVFAKYSEYRIGGWNQDCRCYKFNTGGEYLAKVLEGSECVLRTSGNGCRAIFSEHDMYDPYHNGYDGPYGTWVGPGPYRGSPYGAYGGTYGSYKGLSDNWIIINWNGYNQYKYSDSSLCFFAGLDPKYPMAKRRQILQTLDINGAAKWCEVLDRAEKKGAEGVVGMSYCDWFTGTYSMMKSVANVYWSHGRWGTNPFPATDCEPITKCDGFDPPYDLGDNILDRGSQNTGKGLRLRTTGGSNRLVQVKFDVPQFAHVSLKVYDLLGREVQALINKKQKIGSHSMSWDTSLLPAGVYVVRLSIADVGQRALKQMLF